MLLLTKILEGFTKNNSTQKSKIFRTSHFLSHSALRCNFSSIYTQSSFHLSAY